MTDDSFSADDRVSRALAKYLAWLEAGTRPNREAFLAAHGDVADQLAPLLGSVEAVHGVGRQVSAEIGSPPQVRLRPTTRISRYEVVREIGRGGMGVVYEAVDTDIGQRVAIKVLATEGTTDTRQKERFLREARIAALLQHPNIVPILGVEEMDGVTYLVMQYIDGKPLSAVIRSLRADGGLDSGALDPSSDASLIAAGLEVGFVAPTAAPATSTSEPVLGTAGDAQYFRRTAVLGVQAATALAFVHDNDVLHRDIKPGNLLLDVHGHLWLSDFGLAKAKHSAEAQTTGGRVGTLRYMSPEQAGETAVDRRSDIYSLGATLYELLTLHPAFPSDRPHLLQRVRGEEPPSIRGQNPAVPQDLATIVHKAMAKLPGDRYSTAQELVADLKRFLDGHPVLARPLNRWQRSRRWAWRWRRPLAAIASALLIGLLVGLSAAVWVSWRAYRTETEYRERLERREGLFRELVTELNKSEGVIRHLPNGQGERLRILRRLKEVVCQWADDPGASDQSQVAALRACLLLGEVELLWGDLSNSAAVLHELLERSTALQEANPDDPELRFFTAQGHVQLASVARMRADAALVIEHTNHAIELLERLKTDYSDRTVYRNPLSLAYGSLAEWHAAEYRFPEAVENCRKGIESDQWLAAKYPDGHPQSYIRLGDSLQNLGRFLICAGKPEEAEAALRESVKNHEVLCEPRFAEPKTNRETTLTSRYQLAALLIARGKLKDARRELERAMKEIEAFVELFPDRPRHVGTLAMAYGSLGQLEYLEDRIEESRKAFAKMIVLLNRFPRPEADMTLLEVRSRIPSANVREAADLARALTAFTDPKAKEERNFCLLRALVVVGDAKAAEAILPLIRKPQPHPRYNSELVYLTIWVEAGTGRLVRAKQLFEEAENQPLLEVADDGIVRVWQKKAEQALKQGR